MRLLAVAAFLILIATIGCQTAPTPTATSPAPSTPSAMDLMCKEAIAEMRDLLERGGLNITYYDPRGQLASLVEECLKREQPCPN